MQRMPQLQKVKQHNPQGSEARRGTALGLTCLRAAESTIDWLQT